MKQCEQFKEVFAWRCCKCGRILTTAGGAAERHMKKCKYAVPVLEGQISLQETLINGLPKNIGGTL